MSDKERKLSRHSSLREGRSLSSSDPVASPKKERKRSHSDGKLKGATKNDDHDRRRTDHSSTGGHHRNHSHDKSKSLERSRSRDGSEKGDGKRSEDKKNSRERSLSSEGSGRRKRSQSRDRSTSSERKHRSSSSKEKRDRSRSGSRKRSQSREKSISKPDDTDLVNSATRRRRMSEIERSKRKHSSEGRKSSVLGSLNSFLEEARAASPSARSGDRSVVSSASKIQRRKRRSLPSGSASVFGGQVVADRDEVRRRRSRSFSASTAQDGSSVSENRRELRKERTSSVRSRTPSARSRHSFLNQSLREDSSISVKSSSQPLDHPPVVGESSSRLQRKTSLTTGNGAEVPPGFPVAAVDKNSTAASSDMEQIGHMSGPTMIESTAQIRERQQRRDELKQGGGSSKSLGATDARKQLRRMKSLRAMTPELPPPKSIKVSKDGKETYTGSSGEVEGQQDKPISLSTGLEIIGAKSPIRNSRKKSSGESVASAPRLSDKHRKGSISRGKKKSSTKKQPEDDFAKLKDEGENMATFLGMPEPDDDEEEGGSKTGNGYSIDALNASVASLDPSILTQRTEPTKQINSIMELYHDEANEGFEGELDLKDDSTQGTQENASDSFKQRHGSTSHLNESVVVFDAAQLQHTANMFGGARASGPGYLSPQHSSISGNSDSVGTPKSPSVLRRKAGQPKAESPNLNKRVSWVELPLASPGTLLVKSTDTDGTNERETEASVDFLASLDDLSDEKRLSEGIESTKAESNGPKSEKVKNNPSLGAALEQDKGKKKRQSADERTIGTTATSNTNTSEATMKTNNKSKEALLTSKMSNRSKDVGAADGGLPPLARTASSGSLSRSSRSSIRRSTSDAPSDGSSSTLSSDKKLKRRSSKVISNEKTINSKETKQDPPKKSIKERHQRSASEGRLTPLTPDKRRTSLNRTSSDSKTTPSSKAGSKIKFMSKERTAEGQVSGEPTTEAGAASPLLSPSATPLRRKKSYLNRRNQTKEHKQKSESAKSSIKSNLDNFLEKKEDADASPVTADNRSVSSDGQLKNRKKVIRASKGDRDDRSVSSAPSLNVRRRSRRMSGKTKGGKKVSSWWNLDSKEVD